MSKFVSVADLWDGPTSKEFPHSFEIVCDDSFKVEYALMEYERTSETDFEFGKWTVALIFDDPQCNKFTGRMNVYFSSLSDATLARIILS